MIGEVEQRLKPASEPLGLRSEGRRIGGQVVVAGADQTVARGHRHLALEPHRIVEGHIAGQPVGAGGHQHGAPARRGIGGLERRAVIGGAIAHRAIVTHIHHVDHLAVEDLGHILDHQIVDAHHAAGCPGQIQTQVGDLRLGAPDHVHALPVARSDDGLHRRHLAIAGQRDRGSRPRHRNRRAIRPSGPTRDPHRGQVAGDSLHPCRHAQIHPRLQRRLAHEAQLLGGVGLLQFQAAAEILIRGHQRRIGLAGIAGRARRAILARPLAQPRRKGRRHQHQTIGNCLVHLVRPSPRSIRGTRTARKAPRLAVMG